MLPPDFSFSPSLTLAAVALGIAMAALSPESRAGAPEAAAKAATPTIESTSLDPAATYKQVDLKELVSKSRTEVAYELGQTALAFRSAVGTNNGIGSQGILMDGTSAQKAEYLLAALSMMKISNPPKVTQRVGLDYGGDKAIAAYIDDSVAERLSKDAKTGQALTFYAYHVYNYSRGPALLITSYER